MLRADEWKPSSKISNVLEFARQLLREPVVDDAVEPGIARVYREDYEGWVRRAKEWVRLYAGGG